MYIHSLPLYCYTLLSLEVTWCFFDVYGMRVKLNRCFSGSTINKETLFLAFILKYRLHICSSEFCLHIVNTTFSMSLDLYTCSFFVRMFPKSGWLHERDLHSFWVIIHTRNSSCLSGECSTLCILWFSAIHAVCLGVWQKIKYKNEAIQDSSCPVKSHVMSVWGYVCVFICVP